VGSFKNLGLMVIRGHNRENHFKEEKKKFSRKKGKKILENL
jgi:hypothetical protein